MNELKKALSDSTQGINPKELAADLGSSLSSVYRELQGNVKVNILERVNIWMEHSEGDEIIQKLCAMQGGYFVREINNLDKNNYKGAAQILKEFSEFMAVMAEGYLDGKVTRAEYNRMKKEWTDCNSLVQGMFLSIEKELICK